MEENLNQDCSEFDFRAYVKEQLQLKEMDANCFSPLVLAYMGDCVYELFIRTKVVNSGNMPVNKMHKKSAALVKASAQKEMMYGIMEELTEEERQIYKRGRNAKSATMAKHATVSDYRTATGFEALMGYLYLSGQERRMVELIRLGLLKMGGL